MRQENTNKNIIKSEKMRQQIENILLKDFLLKEITESIDKDADVYDIAEMIDREIIKNNIVITDKNIYIDLILEIASNIRKTYLIMKTYCNGYLEGYKTFRKNIDNNENITDILLLLICEKIEI